MPFDMFLLDADKKSTVIALARHGPDTAIEQIPIDRALKRLKDFSAVLGLAVTGEGDRPTAKALEQFGTDLFDYLFRGDLHSLYRRLPAEAVSIQILSNCPQIREIPWEYLRTPDHQPVPHRNRSVVRIHPTCGVGSLYAGRGNPKMRVLLVTADPIDQVDIDPSEIEAVTKRTFAALMPEDSNLEMVQGATRKEVISAVQKSSFNVFHFFGHGRVVRGKGQLVLRNDRDGRSDALEAEELAVILAGKGVRLAILSACLTGTGDFADDFGLIATALIKAGIPAVIANQYPIPIKSIAPFVGAVFNSLLSDGNIDHAVAEGRAQLRVGLAGTMGSGAVIEWGIPTLYRLADSAQLFAGQS